MKLRQSILKLSSLSFLFLFNINSLSQEEQFIEDIIVTAEKRNESLQTVSQAVTAITDSELEEIPESKAWLLKKFSFR